MKLPKKSHASGEETNPVTAVNVDSDGSAAVDSSPRNGRADTPESSTPICPVCGYPMSEHVIDHSTPNAILECPAPINHDLEEDATTPLDELGMTRRPKAP